MNRGRSRAGISFTMTVVVVAIVLLLAALVVASMGTTMITQFFEDIGGKSDEQVKELEIKEACQNLKRQIDQEFCKAYMPSSYPVGESSEGEPCDDAGDGVPGQWLFCNQYDYDRSAWEDGDCVMDLGEVSEDRVNPTFQVANDTGQAYMDTGDDLNCDWAQVKPDVYGGNAGPIVNVKGKTFNCEQKGYISSTTCPVG